MFLGKSCTLTNLPTANGIASASSTVEQLPYLSKNYAIDDSFNYHQLFTSHQEINPWYQLELPEERMIHSVTIYTREDCCGENFHDIEVRAGFDDAEEWTNNGYPLNQINKQCDVFLSTPGEIGKHYEFNCIEGSIESKYITIHRLSNNS